MKQLSRIASAVALTAGLFASTQVMAVTVCSNCLYTAAGPTFLGAHDATTFDLSGFRRELTTPVTVATAVQDTWLFDLAPVGANASVTASFIPISGAFSGFTVNMYGVTSATCISGIGNSLGTSGGCTGITLGPLVGSSVSTVGGATLFPVSLLAAGRYAFQVDYTALVPLTAQISTYSGQLAITPLPEPGSLALVGLALVGAAAGLRRSRKA